MTIKKLFEPEFEPFEFICPICKCRFRIEEPSDFELCVDDGEHFVLARCPECVHAGATVRPSDSEQAHYLPFVLKQENAVGPKAILDLRLTEKVRLICPICKSPIELRTLKGVYYDLGFWIKCPKCGKEVLLTQQAEQIIQQTLRRFEGT